MIETTPRDLKGLSSGSTPHSLLRAREFTSEGLALGHATRDSGLETAGLRLKCVKVPIKIC